MSQMDAPLEDLLERILREARRHTNAEAGTLFLRADDELRFAVAQNEALARRFGAEGVAERLRADPLPLKIPSLAGYVTQTGCSLNVPDAYQIPDKRPYMFQPWWDARNGYQTRSVLALPLADDHGQAIGVLELINALDAEGQPVPFDRECEPRVGVLATQATQAITSAS